MPKAKPTFPVLRLGHPLARGLIGAWVFSERNGLNANDYSTYQNHGIRMISGTGTLPAWDDSFNGATLNFNNPLASNNVGYVDIGHRPYFNVGAAITVAMWARAPAIATGQTIAGIYDGGSTARKWVVQPGLTNTAALRVVVSSDGGAANIKAYESSLVFTDGNYHFGAFTFGSSTLRLYVDGALDATPNKLTDATVASLFNTTTTHLSVGANWTAAAVGSGYGGSVNCLLMWSRALSADDIAQLYFDTFQMFGVSKIRKTAPFKPYWARGGNLPVLGTGTY